MPLDRGEYDDVLAAFRAVCRVKLQANRRYYGDRSWEDKSPEHILQMIEAEVQEVREAIASGSALEVILECGDLSNCAMMLADRFGMRYIKPPAAPSAEEQLKAIVAEPERRNTGSIPPRTKITGIV